MLHASISCYRTCRDRLEKEIELELVAARAQLVEVAVAALQALLDFGDPAPVVAQLVTQTIQESTVDLSPVHATDFSRKFCE